ncbi:MAG: hypothetical protein R3F11_05730 [Verrucomicrobiales bacterium]
MRVLFLGTGEIGIPALRWLIESPAHEVIGLVTQPDKPSAGARCCRSRRRPSGSRRMPACPGLPTRAHPPVRR